MNSNNPDSLIQKEAPPFYLKIHRNTDDALKCFWHWVDIAKEMGADFYVVCDRAELSTKLTEAYAKRLSNSEELKIISSYLEKGGELLNGFDINDKWRRTAIALITPFLHAKENKFDSFWNIDADDTMFLCDAKRCAEALEKVREYADESKMDCMSLDMHTSRNAYGKKVNFHWTFGITYARLDIDYLELCSKAKKRYPQWKTKRVLCNSLDSIFAQLARESLLKAKSFNIQEMGFVHSYIEQSIILNNRYCFIYTRYEVAKTYNLNADDLVQGIPIAADNYRVDIGITEKDCRQWVEKSKLDIPFHTGKIMMLKEIITYLENESDKVHKSFESEKKAILEERDELRHELDKAKLQSRQNRDDKLDREPGRMEQQINDLAGSYSYKITQSVDWNPTSGHIESQVSVKPILEPVSK